MGWRPALRTLQPTAPWITSSSFSPRRSLAATRAAFPVREWRRKKGVRGEALDARVYGFAAIQALISMGLSLERECERIEATAVRAAAPAVRVAHSRWMQA
jgi:phage terminase large subunit GpA-like protein